MISHLYFACDLESWFNRKRIKGVFHALRRDHRQYSQRIRASGRTNVAALKTALEGDYFAAVLATTPCTPEVRRLLAESDKPLVLLGHPDDALAARKAPTAVVCTSAESVGESAAKYLASLGDMKSFAYVHARSSSALLRASEEPTDWSACYAKAFAKALEKLGRRCDAVVTKPRELAKLPGPIAILAGDDDMALETTTVLTRSGLKIPGDAFVLSVGNDELICAIDLPGISAVVPDYVREGETAGHVLGALAAGERRGGEIVSRVPVKNVVGRTTTENRLSNANLAAQIASCLQPENLQGLSVSSIVAHLGYSRSFVERCFVKEYGISLSRRIAALRLDEVCKMLAGTKLRMEEIAARCGYMNSNYLKNLFKRRFGMTMTQWRRENARKPREAKK